MRKRMGREPVYYRLIDSIKEKIAGGDLRPGDCIGSEYELAENYRISRPSVRLAISELIKEGLICTIPGKGTFVADPEAPIQRESTSRVISFVVPDIQTPFLGEVYRGIKKVADRHDYAVAVYGSDWDIAEENRNILLTMERKESGAIIFPNWGRSNYAEIVALRKAGFPFVLIDGYFRDLPTDYVVVDNFMGGFEAVEYLIKLGHTSIAHVMGMPCTGNDTRLEGYRQALMSHGLPVLDENIRSIARPEYAYKEPNQFCGQEETIELLRREDRPTAIFAGNDFIGLGVLQGVKASGMSVPEDVAVVSFDDLEWAGWPDIQLTTVAQPKEEIGIRAAEILIGKIEARRKMSDKGLQQVMLPTSLVVRNTCGAKMAALATVAAAE